MGSQRLDRDVNAAAVSQPQDLRDLPAPLALSVAASGDAGASRRDHGARPDAFENVGRAATGAVEASLKAAQDYQAKLVQCFQANADANLQLAQKLRQTRSPADFVETMTAHMRDRIGLMTEQAKELAEVSQAATRNVVDALAHPQQ